MFLHCWFFPARSTPEHIHVSTYAGLSCNSDEFRSSENLLLLLSCHYCCRAVKWESMYAEAFFGVGRETCVVVSKREVVEGT